MPRPLHFALRALYAFGMLRLRAHPQPTDAPAVRSGDPTADRVLVVGNGPSHGWGVLTHQLALTGRLAGAVASRTDRPCDADLVGAESMNVRSALAWVGDRDLRLIDALVLVIGANDALRLTSAETWQHELAALLDGLAGQMRPRAVVTVAGIPPMSTLGAYDGPVARLTDRHRLRLNEITRRIAESRGASYVDLPERTGQLHGSAAMYHEFAVRIADDLAARLVAARPVAAIRPPQRERIWQWSGTPAVVELARTGGDADLVRLAQKAEKSFGVELAVVSLVDGDRLYYGNNTDVMPESVPLELAFCKYTVESGEPVVIPDTGRDPRFAGNPLVDVSFINFYAGYPLRATSGEVIGSFCLQGSRPRRESAIALELLRQLAGEAEEVLRGYEVDVSDVTPESLALPAPTGDPVVFES
jgi:hypothetical protein